MGPVKKLYQNMIPDAAEHPEKLAATLERVQEVTDIVLPPDRFKFRDTLNEAGLTVSDPRAGLSPAQALLLADLLAEKASGLELLQIIRLLEYSEISSAEAIDLHEIFKIPVSRLETDIIPVKGEGAWIVANDGKTFLDMDSNDSATNLGNSNEEIARGLFNQAQQLISMKEGRVHIPRSRFLKTIQGMLPPELNHFYWQNSGGEAVDKSLKIAKAYTGQTGVIAFSGGFHGQTHGAISITHNITYRQPFGLDKVDWVHFLEYNDAAAVEKLFIAKKARIVILELVQGAEAGVRPADPAFVKKLRQICDQHQGILICDEVQTGFGRCAEQEGQWFACQNYGIVPDIMVIGQSFGGGYPVSAVVTRKKISAAMQAGYDGSTFGGNPMAMVAAMLATRQMRQMNLTAHVAARSQQIIHGLSRLKEVHPLMANFRVKGLLIGIDLQSSQMVGRCQKFLRENGVMSSLSTGRTLRFLPPLVITESDIKFLLKTLAKILPKLLEPDYALLR